MDFPASAERLGFTVYTVLSCLYCYGFDLGADAREWSFGSRLYQKRVLACFAVVCVNVCLKGLGCAGVSAAETKKELRKVQYTLEQVGQDSSEHFAPVQAGCLIKCVVYRPFLF